MSRSIAKAEPKQSGGLARRKGRLIMAVILEDVPPGHDWGWYSREEQRMHLQTVDERHFQHYKVWLEKNGKRVFEPAETKLRGKTIKLPKKVLEELEDIVAAHRDDIEARWVRLMIDQQWLRLHVTGPCSYLDGLSPFSQSVHALARSK